MGSVHISASRHAACRYSLGASSTTPLLLQSEGRSVTRKILTLAFFVLASVSSNANAWFFFFLPGSVTGKIADSITGAEGENCVGPNAKVGDTISVPGRGLMTIKSLSGTSSRCTSDVFPIRAMLEPSSAVLTQNTSNARIDLPDGWESKPPTDVMKAGGTVLYALNRTIDSGLLLSTAKRSGITDRGTIKKCVNEKGGVAFRLEV